MFTGIVAAIGEVRAVEPRGGDLRLTIGFTRFAAAELAKGDSVCVQGVCLTVADLTRDAFAADVSRETLSLTTLGECIVGTRVNLEPALRAGDPLGGHLVSGHVDGLGLVTERRAEARSTRLAIEAPAALMRYIARKGSVALDGVSLTVNEVEAATFGVNLIPHTLSVTTLERLSPGNRVNIEVDQLARYVERILQDRGAPPAIP
jgi:riboflavin synthase